MGPTGKERGSQQNMSWLGFSLITVFAWGVYGVLLAKGQGLMQDPTNGRYKAFLFVGIAYFLTAVLAPLVKLITTSGVTWNMPTGGMTWSLIAGIAGAIGAFGTLLAFGAKGDPAVVMAIVFGGAPIVNVIVSTLVTPPAGGLSAYKPMFLLGLLLTATGAFMVTFYRPPTPHGPAPHAAPAHAAGAPETKTP